MFLAHVKLVVHHDPQVFFSKAAFQLASHQPVLVPGIIPSQVQDLVFPSIKCHETPVGPFLRLAKVPLDGSTPICIR